ncbi:MAG: hypothetical protein AAGE05_00140 [Pseudomonadota bacterium]
MDNDRLARAIARIEEATARIGDARPQSAPAVDQSTENALKAELESIKAAHKVTLEDRDRTIAKLRADFADIGKLKDEEIERLRADLAARDTAETTTEKTVPDAAFQALQHKYDGLRAVAETALADLDGLIAKAERAENG